MSTGRPTSYSEELEQQARDYITTYEEHGHAMPSVVGLCQVIKRSRATIYRWEGEEDKQAFKDILEELQEAQQLVLFNRSLTGDYNAAIAKLALGKHGYHDKADTTVSGPNGAPVEIDHSWEIKVVG